jgi:Site-specific recombinase XerD
MLMGVTVREKVPGSGVWWIFINHHGKRKSKKVGRDCRKAVEVAKKIEAKLVLGDMKIERPSQNKAPSFKAYAALWLNDYIKAIRRPSTYERYGQALQRHVYPVLGNRLITEITRGEVRNHLLRLYNGGLSKSMIRIIHACISGPMAYALDEEIIAANPITGLTKRLQLKADKEPVEPMTREETSHFLETCKEMFPESDHSVYYPFFLCAFRSGMRLGELLGLRLGDIDWHGRFIEVKRAYKRGYMGPTKTGKARRVDISDHLAETLNRLYKRRIEEAMEAGKGGDILGEPVFQRDGKPMEQNFIRRVFKRILFKSGIRDMRFHTIRHTYASQLLSEGVSPVYVKEQLGHSSIQMTVDIYGRWIPNQNRDAVNRLEMSPKSMHQSAPYVHPAKTEKAQPFEITPASIIMVPKPGMIVYT